MTGVPFSGRIIGFRLACSLMGLHACLSQACASMGKNNKSKQGFLLWFEGFRWWRKADHVKQLCSVEPCLHPSDNYWVRSTQKPNKADAGVLCVVGTILFPLSAGEPSDGDRLLAVDLNAQLNGPGLFKCPNIWYPKLLSLCSGTKTYCRYACGFKMDCLWNSHPISCGAMGTCIICFVSVLGG